MIMLNGARILIVEDEPLIAFDLLDTISNAGANPVGPAFRLPEARKLVSENHLDAALLDIDLGKERVWPLASELQAHGTPFAFISGQCAGEDLPEEFAMAECLEKPASPQKIIDLAIELCGNRVANG